MSEELTRIKPKREIRKLCAQAARAHIRAWRESGMSLPDYCHQHQLAKSTFYGWVDRYERKPPAGFVPVVAKKPETLAPPLNTDTQQGLTVTLPNGLCVSIEQLTASRQVIQFIKGLM